MTAKHPWLYRDPEYTSLRKRSTRRWPRFVIAAGLAVVVVAAGAAVVVHNAVPAVPPPPEYFAVMAVQPVRYGDVVPADALMQVQVPEPFGLSDPAEAAGRYAYRSFAVGMLLQADDVSTEAETAFIRQVREQ